jgi:hypothetical protein
LFKDLASKWGLSAKASRLKVLPANGCADLSLVSSCWQIESQSEILGHIIQDDGGTEAAWQHVYAKLWSAFYANLRRERWTTFGVAHRFALLKVATLGIFLHACMWWPPHIDLLKRIDKCQRHLTACAIGMSKLGHES